MDSSGLVVPGVSVSASQDATGLRQATTTSKAVTLPIKQEQERFHRVYASMNIDDGDHLKIRKSSSKWKCGLTKIHTIFISL